MGLNLKTINDGTHVIADDVLIVGDSSKAGTGNHDHWLIQVLNKCLEIGLKLNADKCTFKSTQVLFFRHFVTSKGIKPDPKKIHAIVQMPVPQNKAQLVIYWIMQLSNLLHSTPDRHTFAITYNNCQSQ